MHARSPARSRGFSLIELVMVVVIIALIGAIAIPRLSRGSAAASASALVADLEAMHKALEFYAAEHGGNYPDADQIALQLTLFTDDAGNTAAARDQAHLYGPYLRAIPPQPLGVRQGNNGIADSDGPTIGWIYDPDRGVIQGNDGTTTLTVQGGAVGGGGAIHPGGGGALSTGQ